jgi:hypothetical protein
MRAFSASAASSVAMAPVGLSRILQHQEVVLPGDLDDGVHIGRAAVEMHRNDGRRPRCDGRFKGSRVQGIALGVHIGKDRRGSGHGNGQSGEGSREGRNHHLIAGADADSAQGQSDSVCAVADSHDMGHSANLGPLCLERFPLFAENEPAPLQHTINGLVDFGMKAGVLPSQVSHGDVGWHYSSSQ